MLSVFNFHEIIDDDMDRLFQSVPGMTNFLLPRDLPQFLANQGQI